MTLARTKESSIEALQIVGDYTIDEKIAEAIDIASEFGITIKIGTDSNEFRSRCSELFIERKSHPIELIGSDESLENSFYVYGLNASGQVVHTQAVTFFDTCGLSLAAYFEKNSRLFCPVDQGLDSKEGVFDRLLEASRISGLIAYHGDIFVSNDYRGTGLALPLTRIAIAKALQSDPDYAIGFVIPKVGYKGIPARYGYPHAQPNGILWFAEETGEVAWNDWLVWATGEDLKNSISLDTGTEHRFLIHPSLNAH